uniref:NADH-ubiquinone oxidoreductase chain 1 n=1 Tax=Neomaskellia andropogonis TaxID=266944 RepID=Q697F7_NEOAD|nr:NADH dehydrogenase subunit 1 [Neomaskellia andropogonis]
MMKTLINFLFLIIFTLMSIAFFTLLERKMISYTRNRMGPMKTSFMGTLQPIADAIKLLSKELKMNLKSNTTLFIFLPLIDILISISVWLISPFSSIFNFMKMSFFFLMSCMAINTITILLKSWSSNSNYAMIALIRSVAQLISYEINLIMIIMIIMMLMEQMNLNLSMTLKYLSLFISQPMLTIIWMITILAETNRTPFDFAESESGLISGFNIEYASKSFVFLFLAEYSKILCFSMISAQMFLMFKSNILMLISFIMFSLSFIWIRTTFVRFRYDKLMKFNWTQMLPFLMMMILFYFDYKVYCAIFS